MNKILLFAISTCICVLTVAFNVKFVIFKINNNLNEKVDLNFCISNKCSVLYLNPRDYEVKVYFKSENHLSESLLVHADIFVNSERYSYDNIGYFVPETIFLFEVENICFYQGENTPMLNLCPQTLKR